MYSFYRKSVSNEVPLSRRNAAPERTMITTATNEYMRRFRNVSRDLPPEEVNQVIKQYSTDLLKGGFSRAWVINTLRAATVGYERKLATQNSGGTRNNRSAADDSDTREAKKMTSKKSWYKYPKQAKQIEKVLCPPNNKKKTTKSRNQDSQGTPDCDQPESVLFTPHTPDSALKKELQKTQEMLNKGKKFQGVRVVERLGPKVGTLVANPAPWRKDPCPNKECTPCQDKPSSCRVRNATYKIICKLCQEQGTQAVYLGETHRTWGDRQREHQKALSTSNPSYATVKHQTEDHPGEEPAVQCKPERGHRSTIGRQI